MHALVVIGRRGATRLDADRAALRLDLLRELGEIDADLIIVRPDIGEAQRLVLGEQVGVPGEHGDLGGARTLQSGGDRGRVGRRHGNAVDLLGDQIGDDLCLLVAAAVLAGTDIEAFDRAVEFLLGLLAASQRLVEEWVVGVLGYQREGVFLIGRIGSVRCSRR